MPFLDQIVSYVNDQLKAGSLKSSKLQPAIYDCISTVVPRKKADNQFELLPAIMQEGKLKKYCTPDAKHAIQLYHKVMSNVYGVKNGYGDNYDIQCISEVLLVVFYNVKLTGRAKEVLEPVVLFGLPQRLSVGLMSEFQFRKCLISPISSNMDALSVFRQEFPNSDYFLTETISMFSVRYRIESVFSQACMDACLCN